MSSQQRPEKSAISLFLQKQEPRAGNDFCLGPAPFCLWPSEWKVIYLYALFYGQHMSQDLV